jgi:hypothetical protein
MFQGSKADLFRSSCGFDTPAHEVPASAEGTYHVSQSSLEEAGCAELVFKKVFHGGTRPRAAHRESHLQLMLSYACPAGTSFTTVSSLTPMQATQVHPVAPPTSDHRFYLRPAVARTLLYLSPSPDFHSLISPLSQKKKVELCHLLSDIATMSPDIVAHVGLELVTSWLVRCNLHAELTCCVGGTPYWHMGGADRVQCAVAASRHIRADHRVQ